MCRSRLDVKAVTPAKANLEQGCRLLLLLQLVLCETCAMNELNL